MEACFAMGDRRMADVLYRAYELGCKLDGWSEQYRNDLWLQAFADTGIDSAFYANRARGGRTRPCHGISSISALPRRFFKKEWQRAQRAESNTRTAGSTATPAACSG